MRILVCAVEAPCPPPSGLRLVLAELTTALRHGHDVLVLAFPAADQHAAVEPGLQLVAPPASRRTRRLVRFVSATSRGRPLSAGALRAAMRPALLDALRTFRPDVVHVMNGKLAGLADDLAGTPAVVVPLDAWHRGIDAALPAEPTVRRWLLRLERRNVARFEASAYARFDGVVVVSDLERSALIALEPDLHVHVVPNGVDVDRFRPSPAAPAGQRLVFTGVMRFGPNVEAAGLLARDVLPKVRSRVPGATLALVGRDPAPSVQALADLPGVEVTGEVPDVRDWLVSSAVFACPPTIDLGMKNKVLEAMACGVGCVVAPSALGGLRAVPGRDLLVAPTTAEMADRISELLLDPARSRAFGAAARAYVVDNHTWTRVAASYEAVYRDAVTRATSRRDAGALSPRRRGAGPAPTAPA